MNRTSDYFDLETLQSLKKQYEELRIKSSKMEEGAEKDNVVQEYVNKYLQWRELINEGMEESFFRDGYDLSKQEITEMLDITEEQVRRFIVPAVDFVEPPEGSGDFFNLENCPNMKLLDMRINKWKKVLIKRSSYESYLEKHLFICCPYSELEWRRNEEGIEQACCVGHGEVEIPFNASLFKDIKLARKTTIGEYVAKAKRENIYRKTRNEINNALRLSNMGRGPLFTPERQKEELEYAREVALSMNIPVQSSEIVRILNSEKNQGEYVKMVYKPVDLQTNTVKKAAVLYLILDGFSYSLKDMRE